MLLRRFCVVVTVFVSLLLGYLVEAPHVFAQSGDWVAPRTHAGYPDLQGVWLNNAAIPMERPAALAGRSQLTDEEVAELQTRANRIFENGRSAFTTPGGAFVAALEEVETYEAWSTSSSIGMVDVVVTSQTSLVVDPPNGRLPTHTAAAQRRELAVVNGWQFKTGPEDFNSIHRCITTGVPRLGGNFGAGPYTYYQIVQTPDYFVFLSEAFHDARIIPLDGRPHVAGNIRQWNGDSRGYWEGDSLVVETRNFSAKSYYRGAAEGLHLVERFTRTGPDSIAYEMTFTDPTTWLMPWSAKVPLSRRQQDLYEFACHEGNVSLVGMLRTARLEEGR